MPNVTVNFVKKKNKFFYHLFLYLFKFLPAFLCTHDCELYLLLKRYRGEELYFTDVCGELDC